MSGLGSIKDLVGAETIKRIKVSESKQEALWKKCVSEARALVSQYKHIRFKVVDLANQCCLIHHGGKYSDERYTLKRFADEIGIKDHTLSEWRRLKMIFDKLPKEDQETSSMENLRSLDVMMKGEKNRDSESFKTKLKQANKKLKTLHPQTVKMTKYLKHLKTIQFNIVNPKMINKCDKEILTEMLHICRKIVSELAKRD